MKSVEDARNQTFKPTRLLISAVVSCGEFEAIATDLSTWDETTMAQLEAMDQSKSGVGEYTLLSMRHEISVGKYGQQLLTPLGHKTSGCLYGRFKYISGMWGFVFSG